MSTPRSTLSPLIRSAGIRATARRLGVTDAALHRWMGGRSALSQSTEKKLAQLFNFQVVTKIEKINKNNA